MSSGRWTCLRRWMGEWRMKIDRREVLRYLGWRGTPIERELLEEIDGVCSEAEEKVEPRMIASRFALQDGCLMGAALELQGNDIRRLLCGCDEALLFAATLGAQSERMLLRAQAQDAGKALILDAVLSAAIEAYCDEEEGKLRAGLNGRHLTRRFSPGYGDMPLEQSGEIVSLLQADRRIGLTVSASGLMIPRKSVTAVMGIGEGGVKGAGGGCGLCRQKDACPYRKEQESEE